MKIETNACVVVSLHSPREKIWGVLVSLDPSGVQVRGIDINTFDDWVGAIAYGERNIGLTYSFLPMWRLERISLDETIGDILSMEEQFSLRIGMSLFEYLGGNRDGLIS